jgi:hypothetical protein
MNPGQTKKVLIGTFASAVLAEVLIVFLGFGEQPTWMLLTMTGFIVPSVGIAGGLLAASAFAGEEEEHSA